GASARRPRGSTATSTPTLGRCLTVSRPTGASDELLVRLRRRRGAGPSGVSGNPRVLPAGPDRGGQGLVQPRALSHRLSELLAALAGSGLLFWHVARHSAFIHFDSGPYLSLAHNLAAHGRLVSNFDFVGN